MADRQANIGVIGAGWWASQFHIPSLQAYDRANLAAVADPDPARLAATADHYGITNTFADYQELLTSADVEGVVIAVPHVYHYEIAKAALDAGIHVLVEKPMVLTAADARDLVDPADSRGLHLMVGTTYQFTRNARQAQEIVQSGKIGTPLFVVWKRRCRRPSCLQRSGLKLEKDLISTATIRVPNVYTRRS